MQLENSGNVITKISFSKKHVTLYFSNFKMKVSKEAYVNAYLFVGKNLSKKDINKLKKMSELDEGLDYALSLLKKNIYTEWKIREKLYAKEIDKKNVDAIIKFLKQNDLINDEAFIENYIQEAIDLGYGKYKVLARLANLGIFKERLDKIKFPDSKELAKAKLHLPSLEKKYGKLNYRNKKKHILDYLIRQGFDMEIATMCLKFVKETAAKDEVNKLREDYLKIVKILSRKDIKDPYQRRDFIINKLLMKGYRYKEIKIVLEEN